jgi:hypothetical protein
MSWDIVDQQEREKRVVVASFSPEKRRGQQRILAGRWCENERAARRSSGNSPR